MCFPLELQRNKISLCVDMLSLLSGWLSAEMCVSVSEVFGGVGGSRVRGVEDIEEVGGLGGSGGLTLEGGEMMSEAQGVGGLVGVE